MKMKQKTIKNKITFSGIGLHSGLKVNIAILPNDNGIIFKRIDKNEIIIPLCNNVVNTQLGTTIANSNGIKVLTIEHLMAGLWACDIDNAIIEIDNEETPIMDGSAEKFIQEIKKTGIQELKNEREYLQLNKEIEIVDGDKFIKYIPDNDFSIEMTVDFNYGNIGKQQHFFDGKQETFINDIAKARTFCNKNEIEYMQQHGLAKGGSLENAMVFDDKGIINKGDFRTENEVVKHKILDCVGDLLTIGYFVKGKIIANKSGHTLHNAFAKKLLEEFKTK